MKKNKKAIFAMLTAIVMSMCTMSHLSTQSESKCIMQVGASCAYMGAETTGSTAGAYKVVAAAAGTASGYFGYGAVAAAATGVGAPVAIANGLLSFICLE